MARLAVRVDLVVVDMDMVSSVVGSHAAWEMVVVAGSLVVADNLDDHRVDADADMSSLDRMAGHGCTSCRLVRGRLCVSDGCLCLLNAWDDGQPHSCLQVEVRGEGFHDCSALGEDHVATAKNGEGSLIDYLSLAVVFAWCEKGDTRRL